MGNQSSSLHNAAAHNDLPKIEALITHQHANIHERDKDGWTPLHFAAYGGALEVTQALLLRGADPEPKDKADRTPLHLAALQGHASLASLLLGRGAHANAKDENLMTPLHKAAIKGNSEVGELLIRLGADVQAAVKDGTRSLHLAAWKGHPDFVKLLVSWGADVQATTKNGRTALHDAAEYGHHSIVSILLAAGANPHIQDEEGQGAAALASRSGHKDIAESIARGSNRSQAAGGTLPSAPPLPGSSGPVHYPNIYQGGSQRPAPASEAAAEAGRNQDFWNKNLGEKDKEQGKNKSFWGAALGDEPKSHPASAPPKGSAAEEMARNKQFWDEKLAGGLPAVQQRAAEWDSRLGKATDAWEAQIRQDEARAGTAQPQDSHDQHPRHQFEQNLLRGAQGLWNTLQGKGDGDAAKRQEEERQRAEAQKIDSEWGGGGQTRDSAGWGKEAPSQQLGNLKPFEDDDDYEEEGRQSHPREQPRGDAARRKLAQLELDLDREQGWIRGGSKAEADASKARQQRIKDQEAEIAALRKQIAAARW